MGVEPTKDFNKRLNQRGAGRGFWYQVRCLLFGGGAKGGVAGYLLRLSLRLLVVAVILVLAFSVFLIKRTSTKAFAASVEEGIKQALVATDVDMRGLSYSRGQLEIARLAAEGANGTFFSTLEMGSLRCKMGLWDSYLGNWVPGVVGIAHLDIDLRAGADDPESAAKVADVLFRSLGPVKVDEVDVGRVNLRWGYSERTQGAIEGSKLKAHRTQQGWKFTFKGGKFRQNWLKNLEIINLIAVCDRDGIVFEQAQFTRGEGTVDMTDLRIAGGYRPEVSGRVVAKHLSLDEVLPQAMQGSLEGVITGDFRVSGSTNRSGGIIFEGQVVMDGGDAITLRKKFHILQALSVMDYTRKYHRIDLNEGSFGIKTGGGGVTISSIDLKAGQSFAISGSMQVRLPTQEEIESETIADTEKGAPAMIHEAGVDGADDDALSIKTDFSLKRAALEAKRELEGLENPDKYSLFDRLNFNNELRGLQTQAVERVSRMLQYEGDLRISIPGDAFDRAGDLKFVYPVDPVTNRILIDVPIRGYLDDMTKKQADEIFLKGRRSN